MGNFHVVSHLSILEKVVEKVVGTQLQGALEQADIHLFNLFSWGSSWYWEALVELVDNLWMPWDGYGVSILDFLDFAVDFNTHWIFLDQLRRWEVEGTVLWSFLPGPVPTVLVLGFFCAWFEDLSSLIFERVALPQTEMVWNLKLN